MTMNDTRESAYTSEILTEQEVPAKDDDDQIQREKERDDSPPTETDPREEDQ